MEVKKIIKIIGKLGLCSPLPPLGTGNAAAMSEDRQRPARAFVHQYMLDALRDPSDPYVIPRQTTQYMALHEFPNMPTTIRAAIHVATQRAANVGLYCPTCDAGLGILLDAYESRVVAFREMRIESYHLAGGMQARASRDVAVAETAGATRGARRTLHGRAYSRMSSAEAMRFEESQRQARRDHNALTILEWDAELWTGVWLRNTLDGYREMRAHGDCISPIARNSAWGVFVAPRMQVDPVRVDDAGVSLVRLSLPQPLELVRRTVARIQVADLPVSEADRGDDCVPHVPPPLLALRRRVVSPD